MALMAAAWWSPRLGGSDQPKEAAGGPAEWTIRGAAGTLDSSLSVFSSPSSAFGLFFREPTDEFGCQRAGLKPMLIGFGI